LSPLLQSTEFGTNHEALAVMPKDHDDDHPLIVIGNNNAASSNGFSGPELLSGDAHVRMARLDDANMLEPVRKWVVPGQGPIHASVHPSFVATANYVSGTIDVIQRPMMDDNDNDDKWNTRIISTDKVPSEMEFGGTMHSVTHDPIAAAAAEDENFFLFGINAGVPSSVAVIQPTTGQILHTIPMPTRARRMTFHPTLPVVYIVYEKEGLVATWAWPRGGGTDGWKADGTPQSTSPQELQRCSTLPPPPPKDAEDASSTGTALNIPTAFLITSDGKFGYTTTRTALAHGDDAIPTAKIGVFQINQQDGTILSGDHPVQWLDTGGWNTRDCVLSPDERFLLAVDVLGHTLTAFLRDPLTGRLEKSSTVAVTSPTSVVVVE